MAYIEQEVATVCDAKGWGHQIRRKWPVRDTPVRESPIEDYEWKIIPEAKGKLPEAKLGDFQGLYFVLSSDRLGNRFVFQHETHHCGITGRHWYRSTYTDIFTEYGLFGPGNEELAQCWAELRNSAEPHTLESLPASGWLHDHLMDLTREFQPNYFSAT